MDCFGGTWGTGLGCFLTHKIRQILEILFDSVELILDICMFCNALPVNAIKILNQAIDIMADDLHWRGSRGQGFFLF